MIQDCLNRYKKLYLKEKEKYLKEKEFNEKILDQLIKTQELLESCKKLFDQIEKVKSKE